MLTLRRISKTRVFVSPSSFISKNSVLFFSSASDSGSHVTHKDNRPAFVHASTRAGRSGLSDELVADNVVVSFKEWFKGLNDPLLDRISDILRRGEHGSSGVVSPEDSIFGPRQTVDSALAGLRLPLTERLVLDVLYYCEDVLSCLKFFDWAGRQHGFYHTRATFNAIFKIIWKAKEKSLIFDYLETVTKRKGCPKAQFYSTLVIGYSVARKPEVALHLFGKMRFQGVDLDVYAYHVLLNALVEDNFYDAADVIGKQIVARGFENEVSHSILVKKFCKLNQLDEAESFIRELLGKRWKLNGACLGVLIHALCKRNQFRKASELLQEFGQSGMVPMGEAYGVWIKDLVGAGKLDPALQFFQSKKTLEGYIPDVFRYNTLVCRLLRENRLEEVYDLLTEMKELKISPDELTMNLVLCFFCKGGMVDFALDLYNSRHEIGFSLNTMAYNYLINTLCGDGSIDEAYSMLKELDYFPGHKTFAIIADTLCREGKLSKMRELLVSTLERDIELSRAICGKFISALCRNKQVEDAYLLHKEMDKLKKRASGGTYVDLINGFIELKRGDIAAKLLIEMQEKGHEPHRRVFRAVIGCLCEMENPERQFLTLLDLQLSQFEPNKEIYNHFIDGAGHAGKPELAREVYVLMVRSGLEPNLSSDILRLQSYLKSEKISDALNLFCDLTKRRKIGRKLTNVMIVGLCKANRADIALEILEEVREQNVFPSLQCYEELVKLLCSTKKYNTVLGILNGMVNAGRCISTFIGNVLLFHSVASKDLYQAWVNWRSGQTDGSCDPTAVDFFIDVIYSERMDQDVKELEQVIAQFFPLDLYTYNMLLRRVAMYNMEHACVLFDRLHQKGFEPNRWTFDTLVRGFYNHGRRSEGRALLEEMMARGFYPTGATMSLV